MSDSFFGLSHRKFTNLELKAIAELLVKTLVLKGDENNDK